MPDSPINPNQSGKKEWSMETRLVIAFVLMGLVLFVSPYFIKPAPAPKQANPPGAAKDHAAQMKSEAVAPKPSASSASAPAVSIPGEIKGQAEQEFVVDTKLYHIKFSNKGGVVRSWLLKQYLDHLGKPLELVNTSALDKVPAPFSISVKDDQLATVLNYSLYAAKPTSDGLGIDYEFSDGKNVSRKSFRFARDSYLAQVTSEVMQNGSPTSHLIEWRGGFGDSMIVNRLAQQHVVYYDVAPGKLIVKTGKDAKDGPVTATGNYSFAGLDDQFFAFVFLPRDNASIEVRTVKDDLTPPGKEKAETFVGVEVGGDSINRFALFVGPKDIDLLRKVDPKLQQLIDWGWFGVIAKPLFLVLHWLNDNFIHNYGWSIVLVTILINLALLPMRFTSLKSQRKMQGLQPQIAAINAKYKGISLRDPRKAEQNQEVMELYKKHGVNPMGGCLPMLVQLPVLYAIYKVLAVTIELRGAHWLWVTDLSQPETLPIHILPLVMIVSQFIMQRMTPNPGMDPNQAKMMMFMPLMFGFFFYSIQSGLVLYWLTGNLVGILQQWLINRMMPAPAPQPAAPPPKKKKARV